VRVLIVKLSSMGDLVQALPALSDAALALPDLRFDWVVDEAFAEIPAWHPAVDRVITTAHRRWRKTPVAAWRSGELAEFLRQLRATEYDLVIDAQTNIKSAIVTRLARGLRCGPDRASVREWGAHWAYQKKVAVDQQQLAIIRWRQMFAQLLDYPMPGVPNDFGLQATQWPLVERLTPAQPYLMAVTHASWSTKCWPDTHWQQWLAGAEERGVPVLLTWGSEPERQRAERLAASFDYCRVLPSLSLSALAGLFKRSAGVVCNDTGLAHVAACLDIPVVTLYGPTDASLIGATGSFSTLLSPDGYACRPCYQRSCNFGCYRGPEGQCLGALSPAQVWWALTECQQRYATSSLALSL
jgi:heptosyltransferase-1